MSLPLKTRVAVARVFCCQFAGRIDRSPNESPDLVPLAQAPRHTLERAPEDYSLEERAQLMYAWSKGKAGSAAIQSILMPGVQGGAGFYKIRQAIQQGDQGAS